MMNIKQISTFIVFLLITLNLLGQGCVAVRGNSSCSNGLYNQYNLPKGDLISQLSYRHFKSFRHFRGSHEEVERVENGTEVINNSNFVDLNLSYGISNRLFINFNLPYVHHLRSSMYEHGGNPPNGLGERHETSSSGIADIRISAGFWLLDPQMHSNNFSFGLGVKLPTGNYNYTDEFYNQGTSKTETREAVVDQSIQPGDGGLGISAELQGFHQLGNKISLNTNLYYLSNPQATNGILTRTGSSEYSCPDQFAVRVAANFHTNFDIYPLVGFRFEGIPSKDLIGSSEGFRRPGYVFSAEPGISYAKNKFLFSLNVPISLYRNRTQSFEDKARTLLTGNYTHGDAAFADYLINFNFAYKFSLAKKSNEDIKVEVGN